MENNKSQFITGKNPIMEALQADRTINKVYIADGINKSSINQLLILLKEKGVIVQYVPRKKIDQLTQTTNHQGIAAEIAAYDYADFDDLIRKNKNKTTPPFFVALDGIEDPHNLGSIIRTADIAGVNAVIIPKRRSASLTTTVAKTSAGAIEHVPVAKVTNLAQAIEQLKDNGFWIIGTDASAKSLYTEIDYKMPVCLIIGSEGKGISRLIKEKCDFFVKMPMKGHVNSLNASVAAAIMIYEVYRQRGF